MKESDEKALMKLTYGLFVAGVESQGKLGGCVINTVSQATAEPVKVLVTMLKTNYTTELILRKGSLTISVLSMDTPMEIIALFGYQSGRNMEKFKQVEFERDALQNPYLIGNTLSVLSLSVEDTIDLDTHVLFICSLTESKIGQGDMPMTYQDYRDIKRGKRDISRNHSQMDAKQENLSEEERKVWVCSVCHYIYEGDIPFEELPEDYICPVCKKPKSVFTAG